MYLCVVWVVKQNKERGPEMSSCGHYMMLRDTSYSCVSWVSERKLLTSMSFISFISYLLCSDNVKAKHSDNDQMNSFGLWRSRYDDYGSFLSLERELKVFTSTAVEKVQDRNLCDGHGWG